MKFLPPLTVRHVSNWVSSSSRHKGRCKIIRKLINGRRNKRIILVWSNSIFYMWRQVKFTISMEITFDCLVVTNYISNYMSQYSWTHWFLFWLQKISNLEWGWEHFSFSNLIELSWFYKSFQATNEDPGDPDLPMCTKETLFLTSHF